MQGKVSEGFCKACGEKCCGHTGVAAAVSGNGARVREWAGALQGSWPTGVAPRPLLFLKDHLLVCLEAGHL